MGALDDAIREHLELKRQHGARDSEIKELEDEAFGPPSRPGDPDFPERQSSDEDEGDLGPPPPFDAPEAAVADASPPPAAEQPETELMETPFEVELEDEPEVEAEALDEEPAGEPSAADHDQPAFFDQQAGPAELDEDLGVGDLDLELDEDLGEDEPSDELEIEEPEIEQAPPPPPAAPAAEEVTFQPTEEHAFEEAESAELPLEEDSSELELELESEDAEDVLEETPEFLRDAPENEELWFEQGEPKDFDFEDEDD